MMSKREELEAEVLEIANNSTGIVFYKDFYALKPSWARGSHWLFVVKDILKQNGYICHERGTRRRWDNCSYMGKLTHFHKP